LIPLFPRLAPFQPFRDSPGGCKMFDRLSDGLQAAGVQPPGTFRDHGPGPRLWGRLYRRSTRPPEALAGRLWPGESPYAGWEALP
jgi:hypothetical protein